MSPRTASTTALIAAKLHAETLGLVLGVWGSAALELYTRLPCTHEGSDLDLLLAAASPQKLSCFLDEIRFMEEQFTLRIDVELELPNGYGVQLKELLGRGVRFLVKALLVFLFFPGSRCWRSCRMILLQIYEQVLTRQISRAAINALYWELRAYPKPGLVSPIDSGSHHDMDASTLLRSLFSLRNYYKRIAQAGMLNHEFGVMQQLGLEAEIRMLKATKNINTHRGAIFTLGLLAAATGYLLSTGQPLEAHIIRNFIRERWGNDILLSIPHKPCSHGSIVASKYGVAGARQEAAAGFPHVFNLGLPSLQESLLKGVDFHSAIIQVFFSLLAVLPDNNLLYRGGERGLLYAQAAAKSFLDEGGVHRKNWHEHACSIHNEFTARHLSPGGSADLLAASLFVHQIQTVNDIKE